MLKKRLITFILLFAVLLTGSGLAGCRSEPSYRRYSSDLIGTFDTVITIIAYCESDAAYKAMEEHAWARFQEMHQLFDLYQAYPGINNVHVINRQAGREAVAVDPQLIDLIETSRDWYHDSPGITNIAFGAVLQIWHDYREAGLADPANARLPDLADLESAAAYTDIDQIVIDHEAGTVFLPHEKMQLDLGATAKGYATEIVARELTDMGYTSFVISSGGNVRTVGQPLDGQRSKWSIGIQNPSQGPDNQNPLLDTAYVRDLSVVTSGDYQRYYTVDGIDYHHIIDPRSLFPGRYYLSVTIIAPDSGLADFLSTTAFLLPLAESRSYMERIDQAEAIWVLPDGEVEMTDGMRQWLRNHGGAENPPPAP